MSKFLAALEASGYPHFGSIEKAWAGGDVATRRILSEYGAVLVTAQPAVAPDRLVFRSEEEARSFQDGLDRSSGSIGGFHVELQTPGFDALESAISEAKPAGLTITPRGDDASRRGYDETVSLWLSRLLPGLEHWVSEGCLSSDEAAHIRQLATSDQVAEILRLEESGIFFSKDLSKSIMYSVAPPGTSQHLSMLALDVAEFNEPAVRRLLARHGWFQTVVSDLPHFTYLGYAEADLPAHGLKKVVSGDRDFWVPDL